MDCTNHCFESDYPRPSPPKYVNQRVEPIGQTEISSHSTNVPTSFRQIEEVRRLAERYAWPEGTTLYLPTERGGSLDDYGRKVVVHQDLLESGLRFPLHPFIQELLQTLNLSIVQLRPHSWRVMTAFLVLCSEWGFKPSFEIFRSVTAVHNISENCNILFGGKSGLRIVEPLKSTVSRTRWFLIEPPEFRWVGSPPSQCGKCGLSQWYKTGINLTPEVMGFQALVGRLHHQAGQGVSWKRYDKESCFLRAGIGYCKERMEFPFIIPLSSFPCPVNNNKNTCLAKRNAETASANALQKKLKTSEQTGDALALSSGMADVSTLPPSNAPVNITLDEFHGGSFDEREIASTSSAQHEKVEAIQEEEDLEQQEAGGDEVEIEALDDEVEIEAEDDEVEKEAVDAEQGAGKEKTTSFGLPSDQRSLNPNETDVEGLVSKSRSSNTQCFKDHTMKELKEFMNDITTNYEFLETAHREENQRLKSELKDLKIAKQKLMTENLLLTQEVKNLKCEFKDSMSMKVLNQFKKCTRHLRLQAVHLNTKCTSYRKKISNANRLSHAWRLRMIRKEHQVIQLSKESATRATSHSQLYARCQALEDEISTIYTQLEREVEKKNEAEKAQQKAESSARQCEAKFRIAVAPAVYQGVNEGIAQFKAFQTLQKKELASGFVLDPYLIKIPTKLVDPDPALVDGIGCTPTGSSHKFLKPSCVKYNPGSRNKGSTTTIKRPTKDSALCLDCQSGLNISKGTGHAGGWPRKRQIDLNIMI